MTVSIGHPPGRETTRALLEKIVGGDGGRRLRAQVARWNTDATPEQIEDALQEACARAERACDGQVEGEVYNWLRTTTHREIAHQRRRRERERIADVPVDDVVLRDHVAPAAEVTAIRRDDDAEIARVTNAVLEQLSERQRHVAALHTRGLRRQEIAQQLQLSSRAVKRSMEQILAIGRDELVRLAGHGCDAGEGLVARFAFGLAGSHEARLAQLHLATCPQCGAMYERLDLWREKVAVLLPLPVVAQTHGHIAERVAQMSTDALSGAPSHVAEPTGAIRRHASAAVAHVREQLASVYYRTVDPTPLAGMRPGAVAAAVAGCLAVGGGATYCVQQGADPIAALTGAAAPAHHHEKHKPKRARAAQAPVAPVVTPTVTAPAPTVTQQTPPPAATTTTQAAPPPAPQDEYEPSSTGGGSTPAQTASSKPSKPAAAPAGGAGEFGGP